MTYVTLLVPGLDPRIVQAPQGCHPAVLPDSTGIARYSVVNAQDTKQQFKFADGPTKGDLGLTPSYGPEQAMAA
jgi:hypothetical protein